MEEKSKKIGIVSVFYSPERDSLNLFRMLSSEGFPVVIYDNGMTEEQREQLKTFENLKTCGTGQNKGLAFGLNAAAEELLKEPAVGHVIFFDQDSKPSKSLPKRLKTNLEVLRKTEKIACLAPRLSDIKKMNTGESGIKDTKKFLEVMTVATSGTIVRREELEEIGKFVDELFIDCIDHEWCFRAKKLGYSIYVDRSNSLEHNMGEFGVNIFGKYKPAYRSPVRHYYIVRNTLYMVSLEYVSLKWKVVESMKTLRRIIFYILVSVDRKKSIKYIMLAIRDGFTHTLGAIDRTMCEK